jgi:hypothetical protein
VVYGFTVGVTAISGGELAIKMPDAMQALFIINREGYACWAAS